MPFIVVRFGVRSPTKNSQNVDKHQIETPHEEFCKNILPVQHKTASNVWRAELGRFPLMIKIQKRDVKFYNHLKGSDSQTFHNKAITDREKNLEKSPLSKLVLGLCSQTQTDPTEPQDSNTIRTNQIMRKPK